MLVHAIKCIIYKPTYNSHKLYVVEHMPFTSPEVRVRVNSPLVVDKNVFVCFIGEGH